MNDFTRNNVIPVLVATGAVAGGIAVTTYNPQVADIVAPVQTHCVLNENGTRMTDKEAQDLIDFYKREVELMGEVSMINKSGCRDFFDELDTLIVNRLKVSNGGGIQKDDLSPTEYRSTLERLLIKRDTRNANRIETLRQSKVDSPSRLSEF